MRARLFGVLLGLSLLGVASPALASVHLMKVVEIFPGTTADPTAQYVVLQMYSGGQNFTNGQLVQVFDASGAVIGQNMFTADQAVGADQTKILIATGSAQTLFNVAANLTLTAGIPLTGGKICFGTIDCVSWGNYTPTDTLPFLKALRPNTAIKRRLDIAVPNTTLGAGDDTNNSEFDFRFGAPTPVNNAGMAGTTPASSCSNGTIEGLESCEDTDTISGDGCSATCVDEFCGDMVTNDTSETCDDGNTTNGDGCDNNCKVTACGNGVVTTGEACDDSNLISGDGCDANCTVTGCGNNVVTSGETCDDGNTTSGDGCDVNCTTTGCGNSVVTQGEACDPPDGITCSATCQVACTGPAECADTNMCTQNERCVNLSCVVDPTPTNDAEPCTADGCTADGGVFHSPLSDGASCTQPIPQGRALCITGVCTVATCGDGFVDLAAPGGAEQCDDGNVVDNDLCTNACTTPRCGDAIVQSPEQCDDGNDMVDDGCTAGCTAEVCGDGTKQANEACDDGNTAAEDGCSVVCQLERCGDSVVQVTETCDDGNMVDDDACTTLCTAPRCGDLIVQSSTEVCDDGNTINGDGCDLCQHASADGGCCDTGSGGSSAALLGFGVLAMLFRRRRR